MPTLRVLAMTVEQYKQRAADMRASTQLEGGFSAAMTYSSFTESPYLDPEAGWARYKPPITEDLSRFANQRNRGTQTRVKKWWNGLDAQEKKRQTAMRRLNGKATAGSPKIHRVYHGMAKEDK